MKFLCCCGVLFGVMTLAAAGELREFTDSQGRKLKAEIIESGDGWDPGEARRRCISR